MREEAQAAYISVTRLLADEAAAAGDADGATRFYLRILERDVYDEAAHLGLVGALLAAGRHGEARRRYGIYSRQDGGDGRRSGAVPVGTRARAAAGARTGDPARGLTAVGLLLAVVVGAVQQRADPGERADHDEKAMHDRARRRRADRAGSVARRSPTAPSDGWTCLEVIGGLGGHRAGRGPMPCSESARRPVPRTRAAWSRAARPSTARRAVSVQLDDGSIVPGTVVPVPPAVADPGVSVVRHPVRGRVPQTRRPPRCDRA